MKPIPEEEIERIKQSIDLAAEIERRGIHLKAQGQEFIGHCPFHDDKTPSFRANPHKGVWHCFGCGKKGNVIQFVMEFEKKDFRDALASLNGSPQTQTAKSPQVAQSSKIPSDPSSQKAAMDVLTYYHQALKNTPTALAYLQKRGLNHPELVDHFKIGFANRSLNKSLPPLESQEGREFREHLKGVGLLKTDGREHFQNRLTFPIFHTSGQLGQIYGRRVGRNLSKTPNHLYLPASTKGIFNHEAIGSPTPLILCECVIDALSFWVHDFRHVTCTFGKNNLTEELLQTLVEKDVQEIWIAFDNEDEKDEAAEHAAKRLLEKGLRVERILLPQNSDINELICSHKDPKDMLSQLILSRRSYNSGLTFAPAKVLPPPEIPQEKPSSRKDSLAWTGEQAEVSYGERHYRLRGLERARSLDYLKVQIRLKYKQESFLDTVDLGASKSRAEFIKRASEETGLAEGSLQEDIKRLLPEMEGIIEQLIHKDENAEDPQKQPPPMSEQEQSEALAFLKDPQLLQQIIKDFDSIGLVGEETNKLIGYLAAISRKLDDPLAVLIQSSSSAGKTTLMDGILNFVPPEEQEKWTTLTGQALYYVEKEQLQHKLLAIAEEEGMEKATYPLKILQSEKELKIAVAIKDPKSGDFKTQSRWVVGPCGILLTTTLAEVDEELANRFIRLTVNEDREQTQAIHQKQREAKTLIGLKNKALKERIKTKHHNAQRLLRPLPIYNPFAEKLTFNSNYLRSRRDHQKYLHLIDTLAFLHQYQRPTQQILIDVESGESIEAICVELSDIEEANRLITEVLGRCLDELSPQTRRLLNLLDQMVREKCEADDMDMNEVRFTRRQVREYTCWTDNQLKVHMKRLEELEYVLIHHGGRGQLLVYELLWSGEGEDGERFIPGLIDPKKLVA